MEPEHKSAWVKYRWGGDYECPSGHKFSVRKGSDVVFCAHPMSDGQYCCELATEVQGGRWFSEYGSVPFPAISVRSPFFDGRQQLAVFEGEVEFADVKCSGELVEVHVFRIYPDSPTYEPTRYDINEIMDCLDEL